MTLLTAKQAAAELKVTEQQVRLLVRGGLLSFVNVGLGDKNPRMRFDEEEIAAFKARRTQTRGPPGKWPHSTKTRGQNSTGARSGSGAVSFLARQKERADAKLRLQQEKSKKS
jgi:hypothetical protein